MSEKITLMPHERKDVYVKDCQCMFTVENHSDKRLGYYIDTPAENAVFFTEVETGETVFDLKPYANGVTHFINYCGEIVTVAICCGEIVTTTIC